MLIKLTITLFLLSNVNPQFTNPNKRPTEDQSGDKKATPE